LRNGAAADTPTPGVFVKSAQVDENAGVELPRCAKERGKERKSEVGGVRTPLFFVSADSKEVRTRGLVTAEFKGVEVALESADAKGVGKCFA